MEENKKKSNKGLIVLVVILIVLLLGTIGYICYDKFKVDTLPNDDKKPASDTVKSDDFYSISNLVSNHYIKKMTDTSSENIKIKNGSVYYVSTMDGSYVKDTNISGTPVAVYSDRTGGPAAPYYFYVLTSDNVLYYCIQNPYDYGDGSSSKSEVPVFIKIDKSFDDVYVSYIDDTSEGFIGISSGDDSLYIHSKDGFVSTYKELYKYPDYLKAYASDSGYVWSFDKDKKLYYYDNSAIKEVIYNGDSVNVSSGFNGNLNDNIVNFVIDSDNNLLYANNDKTGSVSLYKNSKVKDVKYTKTKDSGYDISITFEDGSNVYLTDFQLSSLTLRNNS